MELNRLATPATDNKTFLRTLHLYRVRARPVPAYAGYAIATFGWGANFRL